MFCRTTWRYPINPSEETQASSAVGGEHLLPSSDPVSVQCLLQELQQAAPNSSSSPLEGEQAWPLCQQLIPSPVLCFEHQMGENSQRNPGIPEPVLTRL